MSKPNIIRHVLKAKCPNCGKGDIFLNKKVFPLSSMLKTVDYCSNCEQKINTGNDSAPGMNYALSVVAYILGFALYACIWDITYKDNSFIYSFIFSTVIVILAQPWLMRLSKVIYIYIFIKSH